MLLGISGCTTTDQSAGIFPQYPKVSTTAPAESCEALGQLSASADCACYDKMSYQRVGIRASDNLAEAAHDRYPDSDVVQVSDVDLFLNNAVAHGVAYQCDAGARDDS